MNRELSPLGHLLEEAREQVLRISGREAARRAGITEARWRQVVRGVQTRRDGRQVPANPKPVTVVAMALAVEIDPAEALDTAGIDASPATVAQLVQEVQSQPGSSLSDLGLDAQVTAEIERIKGLSWLSTEQKLAMIRAVIDVAVEEEEARAAAARREDEQRKAG